MRPEQSEEDQISEVEPEVTEVENMEALKQALADEKKKAEANLAGWQRTQADFINYKHRSEQEKEEIGKFANITIILNLLSIIDDFERAFSAIPARSAKTSWVEGIRLIERKLRASLEAQGLSQIEALGEPFDPNFHEAVRQDRGKDGIVVEELQRGYKLHDRVIRPAKVVVGNGEEEENKEE